MDVTADLDVFFADFAGTAATSKGEPFVAIYDAAYADVLADPSVDSTAPAITCKTADLVRLSVTNGTTITVADVNGVSLGSFKVRSNQPDGTGISVLILEKV